MSHKWKQPCDDIVYDILTFMFIVNVLITTNYSHIFVLFFIHTVGFAIFADVRFKMFAI